MKKDWNNLDPDTELTFEEAVQYVMDNSNFDAAKASKFMEEHFQILETIKGQKN